MFGSKPETKSKWDFGFEADAAQRPTLKKLVARITPENLPDPSVAGKLLRQRRAKPRFSDVVRAGEQVGVPSVSHVRSTDNPGDCLKCGHSWARHIMRGTHFQCMCREIDASGNFDGCGCSERPPAKTMYERTPCCSKETRTMAGGCSNCGDPSF